MSKLDNLGTVGCVSRRHCQGGISISTVLNGCSGCYCKEVFDPPSIWLTRVNSSLKPKSLPTLSNSPPRPQREGIQRRLRYVYLRFIRLRGTPEEIARGAAVGVFAGMYPFFGFQTILSVGIAVVVRGNKLAAAAATWISNPFTYVPFYAFNFQVGRWLLQADDSFVFTRQSLPEILHAGSHLAMVMVVGCTVVGAITAAISYPATLWLVRNVRHRLRLSRKQARDRRR